jgi:hypothetical protein
MKTTISTKGQIVLPAQMRSQDGIDHGEYRLSRKSPPPNDGVVDWLLDCPTKGFFVPIESESTDHF